MAICLLSILPHPFFFSLLPLAMYLPLYLVILFSLPSPPSLCSSLPLSFPSSLCYYNIPPSVPPSPSTF